MEKPFWYDEAVSFMKPPYSEAEAISVHTTYSKLKQIETDDSNDILVMVDYFYSQHPEYREKNLELKTYYWNLDSFWSPQTFLYDPITNLPVVHIFQPL